jgi:hypothetical protein
MCAGWAMQRTLRPHSPWLPPNPKLKLAQTRFATKSRHHPFSWPGACTHTRTAAAAVHSSLVERHAPQQQHARVCVHEEEERQQGAHVPQCGQRCEQRAKQ